MGKLQFKDREDEHNSYQSYTDLMSGFLIVFMLASAIAFGVYTAENGGGDIGTRVAKELKNAIIQLKKAQKELDNKLIEYDSKHLLFRVNKYVEFEENSPIIPVEAHRDLIKIGQCIEGIVQKFDHNKYVGYRIIIDGRIGEGKIGNKEAQRYLSYKRAYNLFCLWEDNKILSKYDVVVSGSGLEGIGREPGKNRTFVIQVIPYVKIDLTTTKK